MEQIKTAALFKPIGDSLTYQSYLNGIQEGLYNTWDTAVRTGYLTGQTTQQIVRKVLGKAGKVGELTEPGTMQKLRNSVWANTRTALQSFANETQRQVYSRNEQYFGSGRYNYQYLATLDNRTCIVCASEDGKLYRKLSDAPALPQHRNCRCLLIPYFDIEGETRSSPQGYISSKITFEDWLKEQDAATQKDVLGVARYKLFNEGTSMNQFVDNGKVLNLKQLYEKLGIEE